MPARTESISDDQLRAALERARRLSEMEPEPYRSLAFQTLLSHLISSSVVPASEPASGHLAPGLDLTEFLASLKAETHPDRVLAIAYYQERYSAGPPVTAHDLTEAYQRARLKRPQNFPDVIASVVRKGYLVEQGRREGLKSWGLTGSGAAHVERDL